MICNFIKAILFFLTKQTYIFRTTVLNWSDKFEFVIIKEWCKFMYFTMHRYS